MRRGTSWCGGSFLAFVSVVAVAATPRIPLPDGTYVFVHRFAEHPSLDSVPMQVRLHAGHVVVTNATAGSPFPIGVVDKGTLAWHAKSRQWIVVRCAADRTADDVGGCSDGPAVIDLVKRIYWTC